MRTCAASVGLVGLASLLFHQGLLIGFWFLIQLFSQVGAVAEVKTGGGVAYAAHVGGFILERLLDESFSVSGASTIRIPGGINPTLIKPRPRLPA